MFKRTMIVLAMTALTGVAFSADKPVSNQTPGLDKREVNQARRIENGEQSGQLNTREAARLEHAEDRLDANEAKAKADGKVTAKERARLQAEANANSKRIYRQKHDAQGARHADRPRK
jgi:hypothetical protein